MPEYKYADPAKLFKRLVRKHLKPPIRLTVSKWADQNRRLTSKTSSEPGPWRTSRTPYLREPMDAMSALSTTEKVVLMFGTQLGKSSALENILGYVIAHEPGPAMVVMPTSTLSKRWSQQRLVPLIESTPVVDEAMTKNVSRDDSQSQLLKTFAGGVLVVAGANSAADLRSMPVRYLLLDETDAYPLDVDSEGSPIELAIRRTDTFARKKILLTSTPTVKGFSHIEAAYEESDRQEYWVPCPHCEEFQLLKFGQLKWPSNHPEEAHYVCEHCGAEIEEKQKTQMLEAGEWRARNPRSPIKGYHLSSLYSPHGWVSWGQIATEFTEAKQAADRGDVSKLKVFVNTRLAETWEEQGDKLATHEIQRRAEDYGLRTLPDKALVLTAAVDVQGDRLEVMVQAWGRGEESWIIDYNVIYGDPGRAEVWKDLDQYLLTPFVRPAGEELSIKATAIDSGGHHTHQVYLFCAQRRGRHVIAVKGQSQADKPILGKPTWVDINYRGDKIKNGTQLWPLGSDTAKSLVYGRLRIPEAGSGYIHFSKELPGEFFEGITSERLVTRYVKGRAKLEWVKPAGVRNEPLDLAVMNCAAAMYLGIPRWKEPDWARLDHKPQPVPKQEHKEEQPNVLPLPEQVKQQRPMYAPPRRRGGFAMGWK